MCILQTTTLPCLSIHVSSSSLPHFLFSLASLFFLQTSFSYPQDPPLSLCFTQPQHYPFNCNFTFAPLLISFFSFPFSCYSDCPNFHTDSFTFSALSFYSFHHYKSSPSSWPLALTLCLILPFVPLCSPRQTQLTPPFPPSRNLKLRSLKGVNYITPRPTFFPYNDYFLPQPFPLSQESQEFLSVDRRKDFCGYNA